jgi:hypothetical protein
VQSRKNAKGNRKISGPSVGGSLDLECTVYSISARRKYDGEEEV